MSALSSSPAFSVIVSVSLPKLENECSRSVGKRRNHYEEANSPRYTGKFEAKVGSKRRICFGRVVLARIGIKILDFIDMVAVILCVNAS